MRPVWVLLTCDIHTHVQPVRQVHEDLTAARQVLRDAGLRCTFFFPAHSAELLRDQVAALQREGHEIGCHGLTHVPSESYDRLSPEVQEAFLIEATDRLRAVTGERPRTFRAPVFKLSGPTIRVLEALGYEADLSITAQRLGFFGSDFYNLRPLFAPRSPYHPSVEDPYHQGSTRLWEIPVSAFGLPFVSNAERAFGLAFMRMFFRGLSLEAQWTGKPIVFMFHVEDLNANHQPSAPPRLSWKDVLPSRTDGLMVRHLLMEHNWQRVQRDQAALFQRMQRLPGVRFVTATEYLDVLNGGAAVSGDRASAITGGWLSARALRAAAGAAP